MRLRALLLSSQWWYGRESRRMIALAFVLSLAVFSAPQPALSQTTYGSIVGLAKDPSGAVLPGTAVTITNEGTRDARESKTDSTGFYRVPNLLPGFYTVSAQLQGFKTWTSTGIEVRLNQAATIDINMELGAITQTVEIRGEVPLLQTVDSTVGNVVGQKQVQNLPLNGRDFTQLTLLVPGAAPASLPGGFFVIGGQPVAVSGNRPDQNNYTLDGTYNNETFFKFYGLRPSVDAIQEFNIQTNIVSARYGAGGVHVDLATRSGSNNYHGSVFEFLRNDKLDANDFFRNASGASKPSFRMNNFGAVFGGPVHIPKLYNGRDRTFFFLNYEGLRRSRGGSGLAIVPTAAMLAGDLRFNTDGSAIPQIYDPFTTCGFGANPACALDGQGNPILTRQPFLNNQIPTNRFDPVSAVWNQMFYANPANVPNRVIAGVAENLINTQAEVLQQDQFTMRGDHRISDTDNVYARFSFSNVPILERQVLPTQMRNRTNSFRNLTFNWAHTFNATTALEFRYGYSRDNIHFDTPYQSPGFQALINAGFTGVPPKFQGFDTSINLSPSGFAGADLFVFQNGPDRNHQFIGNLLMSRGRHTINVGVDIKRTAMFHDGQFSNWAFTDVPTADPQNLGNTGFSFASFLLGVPSTADRIIGNAALDGRQTDHQFYLQDDIKLTSNLTMNIGLRYEWNQWFRFVNDTISGFDSSNDEFVWAGYNYILGQPSNTRRTFTDPDFNNFAPRLGFAYRLNDKTTVRLGYGVFYARAMTWEASQNRGNWPYAVAQTLTGLNTAGPTARFDNVFPSIDLAAVTPSATHTADRRGRWPYMQQWNLHIQRELAKDLMLEVGYVGSKGTKLSTFISPNDPRPGPGVIGCPDPFNILPAGSCTGSVDHPRPHPKQAAYSENFMANNSRYHSLQTKLERRFTGGLSLIGSYTWSKNIDLASTFGGDIPQDYYNRKVGYGRSQFDLRHNFVVSSLYELPFGPGRRYLNVSGPAGKILEGWNINSIVSLRSGFPFNVCVDKDIANVGTRGGCQHPDQIAEPSLSDSQRTPQAWFNTSAYAYAADFTFGSTGRNTGQGPGFKSVDLGLHKITKITENHRIEFRAEFFNAFNNVNFANPASTFGAGGFGTITSTVSNSREIQFALKYSF